MNDESLVARLLDKSHDENDNDDDDHSIYFPLHHTDITNNLNNDEINSYNDEGIDQKYVHFNDLLSSHLSTLSIEKESRLCKVIKCAYAIGTLTFVAVAIAVPVLTCLSIQQQAFMGPIDTLFFSAAIFVLFTVCLSVYEIVMHLTHWYVWKV